MDWKTLPVLGPGTVTFTRHNPKQINGNNGPFTVHEFFTAEGAKYETSKAELANAAYALLNQPIQITWKESQNGQWTNRRLESVAGQGMSPGVMPSGAQSAPTGAPQAQAAPAQAAAAAPSSGGVRQPDHPDTAARIARSVGADHGVKALELALKAAEHGLVEIGTPDQWATVALWVVSKATELGGEMAKYVYKGSRPSSPAAASADSSGAGGGGEAGAAPAAPAPTSAEPQAPATDDDIPF